MSNQQKPCPYCGESIQMVAQKCRYCGEWLTPRADPVVPAPAAIPPAAPAASARPPPKPHVLVLAAHWMASLPGLALLYGGLLRNSWRYEGAGGSMGLALGKGLLLSALLSVLLVAPFSAGFNFAYPPMARRGWDRRFAALFGLAHSLVLLLINQPLVEGLFSVYVESPLRLWTFSALSAGGAVLAAVLVAHRLPEDAPGASGPPSPA